jgi:Ca2+-binding RTX toxin-like protein
VTATVEAGYQNVKVDLVNSQKVLSSASTVLGSGANNLGLLGAANINGTGNDQANVICGNSGANVIQGLGGNDILDGGLGRDVLTGGAGQDVFDFNSRCDSAKSLTACDCVTDFISGADRIDLSTIDARKGVSGNQSFRWIGTKDFHEKSGELHYQRSGSGVLVSGDINGDGKADFCIHLENLSIISKSDFIL